jgi:ribonuclease E
MIIDATYPEETRVVVLNGNRLEEFDFESSNKKQIKGNIYLAKITRVEPSLQAAFVEYGGTRHGFLAFSEIHPDYYRIPVSDREALMAAERAEQQNTQFDDEPYNIQSEQPVPAEPDYLQQFDSDADSAVAFSEGVTVTTDYAPAETETEFALPIESVENAPAETAPEDHPADDHDHNLGAVQQVQDLPTPVETVGGDEYEDVDTQPRVRHYRHYKIQEVIKRRQILLVQVTKEERGTKGAALTTYLSLAGRYCVLMPNAGRGGGVSRKITSAADRRRLKELMDDLDVPEGMGVIVRTAGSERSKAEIKRDYEYLLRLWDDIRELTLRSSAPALIYEEGSLIKRAIRDLYTRDIEEILVEGAEGYKTAKEFMRMLMPSHAARVKLYRDPSVPLFHRYQIDAQIDQIHNPVVQLRSGGYIVINPTEALVSIDVNSGRATKERNIEETATKTNLEAADEIARQLRLRDLAGLVVIDFIDMEESRNQKAVEARVKEAMKSDRARIQLGRISPFGLLELSRQRLRSSLIEASTQTCPHCNGTGTIRSTESTALVVLRALEEEGIRLRTAELSVAVPTHIALYILNQKREALIQIEQRYGFRVTVLQDDTLIPPAHRIERIRALTPAELAALPAPVLAPIDVEEEFYEEEAQVSEEPGVAQSTAPAEESTEEERAHRKRRRRRRRRGPGEFGAAQSSDQPEAGGEPHDDSLPDEDEGPSESEGGEEPAEAEAPTAADAGLSAEGAERRRRRRGKRGGKRRRPDGEPIAEVAAAEEFDVYASPFDYARDGRPELFGDVEEAPAPLVSNEAPVELAEPTVSEEPPVEAVPPVEPTASEAPAKRRRAPRRKAAETVAPEVTETAEAEPKPAEKPKRTRARKPKVEAPATETPEPAPVEIVAAAPEPVAAEAVIEPVVQDDRPRKTGWWKRLLPQS